MGHIIRPLLTAITVLLMSSVVAQELSLTPKWKRDDSRTMYLTEVRTLGHTTAGDEGIPEPRTYKTSGRLKVYDVTPQSILISIDHENVVLPVVRPYFEGGTPPELSPYKRMVIRYTVDRNTGSARLMNATDLREFAQRAADISLRVVRRADANAASALEEELGPLVASFNDPGLAENYFDDHFGFLTHAFGKPLKLGEPLRTEEKRPDPYGAVGDSVLVTTTTILESHSSDQPVVKVLRSLSPRPQPEPGKGGTRQRPPPVSDAVHLISWKQEQSITLDERTTWPIRMVMNTQSGLSDGSTVTEDVSIEVR